MGHLAAEPCWTDEFLGKRALTESALRSQCVSDSWGMSPQCLCLAWLAVRLLGTPSSQTTEPPF